MKVFKIITNPKSLSPKRLFRAASKKTTKSAAVSRSEPSSFAESTTTTSSSSEPAAAATPKSVLPHSSSSGEWSSDVSELTYLDLQHAFRIIDRDNDGVVSKSELASLLGRLGSSDEVAAMLSELGRAGGGGEDGTVTVEALMGQIGSSGWEPAGPDELKETFGFFDLDRDGRITAEELLAGFSAIGDAKCTLEECRRMIAEVDKNGDGFVCLEDFCRMMDLQR